jgi:hypothetical protein
METQTETPAPQAVYPKLLECGLCYSPLALEDHLEELVCRFCCGCPQHGTGAQHRCGCGQWTSNTGQCSACFALNLIAEPAPADKALAQAVKWVEPRHERRPDDESASYRSQMQDAGRGRLLR